jgi:hypothetical protein
MVQLRILSGKKAGATWVARRFPVRIGRAAGVDLQSQEDGVWDQHLLLDLNPATGFVLTTEPSALASVNGHSIQQTVLRNGDEIQLGSLRLQFLLAETCQFGLGLREVLTWSAIAGISLAQLALLYWLVK